MSDKKSLEELKILVFEQDQATKQNKDRLFKLAKASNDIETIQKLADQYEFKSAKVYLDKLDNLSVEDTLKNRDFNPLKKLLDIGSDINEEFLMSCQNGAIEKVIELLKNPNVDINIQIDGLSALVVAHDNLELVELLLKNGADINMQVSHGMTSLFFAAKEGKSDLVKLLLDNGADVNIQAERGVTALIMAIENNHFDIVTLLLTSNCNINLKFDEHDALALAIIKKNTKIIEAILICRAKDINLAELYLMLDNIELLELAIKNGADVNSKSIENNLTVLEMASYEEEIRYIQLLVENNAIEKQIDRGGKALLLAVSNNKINSVQILLDNNANINFTDENGFTALMLSVAYKNNDIFNIIIKYGNTDINLQTTGGDTALHHAVNKDSLETVNTLLEHNINVNVQNNDGTTPLMIAVSRKNLDITKALLDAGADCSLRDYNLYDDDEGNEIYGDDGCGDTVLMVACKDYLERNNSDMIKLLLEYTKEINTLEASHLDRLLFDSEIAKMASHIFVNNKSMTDEDVPWTLLMHILMTNTIMNMYFEDEFFKDNIFVKCSNLLQGDIDINFDHGGETALDFAQTHGLLEVAELIKAHSVTKKGYISFEHFIMHFIEKKIILVNIVETENTIKLKKDGKNSYTDSKNNKYVIEDKTVVKTSFDGNVIEYKIQSMVGNIFDTEHNPIALEQILSNFRKATPFKWLTHSTDKNQLIKDYDSFDGYLQQVRDKFIAIKDDLKILSPYLYRKIYDFALNPNIEKSWCSKGDIKIGWSSLEGLKEWCDSGEKAFDFKLKEPIMLDEKELIYWKDVVELFKKEIEIRNDDSMLYQFFVDKRKKIRKDTDRVFSIELINEDDFKNAEFYTDVEEFSNAVDTIFEMMTHNKRKEYPKIKVSVINNSAITGDKNFLDIRITQIGSFSTRDAKSLEKVVSGGDFDKIKTNLKNLCNWSIENSDHDKDFRVDYLKNSSMGDFEALDYDVEGFTHILRFKKR